MQTENLETKSFSLSCLIEKVRHPRIVSFFMGWQYPIWIAFSVLVGRMTNLEVYFAVLDLILIAIAFVSCNSVRPILPIMISFLYRVSLEHSPGTPIYSDYYLGGGATIVVPVIFLMIALASLFALLIRKKCFTLENLKKLPLLVPLSVLSLAFLLSGSFSGFKTISDVYFSLLQILFFAIVFWLLYLGFKDEDASELCSYFTYVCAVVAVILIVEVIYLYATNNVIGEDGIINKGQIFFGWGISNTCANCLTVLVPICFLGVIKSKYHIAYFVIATLAYVANIFTLSRNGVLFGTVFYVISLAVCCVYGERKKLYRYITLGGIAALAIGLTIFGNTIRQLFMNMINSGLNDSGRYSIWYDAFDVFCKYPIFGKGFYSFMSESHYASFIPFLAHNTILELMMATGVFGIAAYLVYRVYTFIPFIKKPRVEKFMLLLSIGVLITESLIDNFILWFAPTIAYNVAIIIAIKFCEQDSAKEKTLTEATACVLTFDSDGQNIYAASQNEEAVVVAEEVCKDTVESEAFTEEKSESSIADSSIESFSDEENNKSVTVGE